ncbi:hypothetical protein C8J57DRAFT_1497228 [Mycena rebaudengoi]|nr:hypothetical protein C8J57DRAFT_1497228 [Mycena rebaudengoi]
MQSAAPCFFASQVLTPLCNDFAMSLYTRIFDFSNSLDSPNAPQHPDSPPALTTPRTPHIYTFRTPFSHLASRTVHLQ